GGSEAEERQQHQHQQEQHQHQHRHRQQQDAAMNFAPSSVWGASRQERHLEIHRDLLGHSQEPSPPHSSSSSSHSAESWPYGNFQPTSSLAPLHQLLTKHRVTETRSVHGQLTPPTRESSNPILAGGAFDYNTALLGARAQAESQHPVAPQSSSK